MEEFQQSLSLWEGQILVDKYRVDRLLGVGGMGAVFAAHHLQFDTPVAIKCMRTSLLVDPEAAACFVSEARAAIEMNNEHVARVFDVGTLVTGAPYMVMEFLDGVDLGTWLRDRGPLPMPDAVDFVLQACEGLAVAHAVGIVHRDLKPDNLFCVKKPDGRLLIKVIDFGISRAAVASPLSQADPAPDDERDPLRVITGTPHYMSPEQLAASDAIDARTDIWALGVILYELLSCKTPFPGSTLAEIAIEISSGEPLPLRGLCPEIPEGLAAVISRCLQKDPRDRPSNVAELARALMPFGSHRARLSAERTADILCVADPAPVDEELSPPPAPPRRTPRAPISEVPGPMIEKPASNRGSFGIMALAGVLAFVAAGLVSLAFVSRRSSVRSEAMAQARPPVPMHPVRSAFVVPNSATDATRQVAFLLPLPPPPASPASSPASPSTLSILHPALHPAKPQPSDRGVNARPSPRRPVAVAGPRSPAQAAAPGDPAGVVPAGLLDIAKPAEGDCRPSFEFDEQGRRHFKADCPTARTSVPVAATSPKSNPGCDPSFDLDEQGRKHFKPECFLKARR